MCLNFLFVFLQWQTNCSTLTLQTFLVALSRGKLGDLVRKTKTEDLPKDVKVADKKMQRMAGVSRVYLHGCVACNKYVWAPEDPEVVCEHCGGDRFDVSGKSKEFVVHFPLKLQFASLLTCKQHQAALLWESLHVQNPDYMSGDKLNACVGCMHAFICV